MERVFGPVPSRRLGRSVGINNVPPKTCSYACVYCQLGRTVKKRVEPCALYPPDELIEVVATRVRDLRDRGETVDYLTFVPDGEPTLDIHLRREIDALTRLGLPIAVISNASLISQVDVRRALSAAAWVSLKVDAASEAVWRRIDRPHRALSLAAIQSAILEFSRDYVGHLVTETMLVAGINDQPDELERIARLLERVAPRTAYLAVPTRPPAEQSVTPPSPARIVQAHAILSGYLPSVELLIGYEGDRFAATGDAAYDLRSITAVHPMREDAVRELLTKDGATWSVVDTLLASGDLVETRYGDHLFYLRAFHQLPPGA